MTPLSTRAAALSAIVAGHVAVVSALTLAGPVPVTVRAAAITLHAVPAPVVAEVAPVITLDDIAVDVAAPTVEMAEAAPAIGGDCAIVDQLTAALAGDAATARALDALPVERQSMANAVMAWDGRWAEAPAPVRRAVVERLRASPVACRAVEVTGPRLLIVPTGARPVVLAFGSGRWRWNDLLADSRDQAAPIGPAGRSLARAA